MLVNYCDFNQFLIHKYANPDWSKGISRSRITSEWRDILYVVKKYFTYEGRNKITFQYHLHFLLHFNGVKKMNVAYYMFKILIKTERIVQLHPQNEETNLLHHGLIRLLIE